MTGIVKITPIVAVIIIVVLTAILNCYRKRQMHSRMLSARLRDISELCVEEMRCTLIHSTKEPRRFFGKDLPLVRERAIFVVDAVVKIGFNFDQIQVKVDNWHKKITLHLPEMRVISNAIQYDTMMVLDEKTGIFATPHIEWFRDSMNDLCNEAEEKAKDWGVFDRAKASTRDRLTILVGKFFDLSEYALEIFFADGSHEITVLEHTASGEERIIA